MIKATLITEGNNKLGLGPIIRTLSLYQAFEAEEVHPHLIVHSDSWAENLLRGTNSTIFDWLKDQKRLFTLIKDSDITIVDSMRADLAFYKRIAQSARVPVYIDDTQRLAYPKGVIINRTVGAEKYFKRQSKDHIYLLGTRYLPLTKAFWYAPWKTINPSISSILLTFGGTDVAAVTPTLLRAFIREYPKLKKMVIVGRGFENIEEIRNTADNMTQIYYFPSGESMKYIMLDADLAISAGGQTLYELARIGVPTIAISVIDNQTDNINGLTQLEFLEDAGLWDANKSPARVSALIKKLTDQSIRKEKREIGRNLVDGYGSVRIVNFLLGLAQTGKIK